MPLKIRHITKKNKNEYFQESKGLNSSNIDEFDPLSFIIGFYLPPNNVTENGKHE